MVPPPETMAPMLKDQDTPLGQKTNSSTATRTAPKPGLKCPRCDSANTKFCYYNNYSLTQPRHFCKTCRRYWTNGGALRNVAIGGGCRKNKRAKPYSSSSSSSCEFNFQDLSVPFNVDGLPFPPNTPTPTNIFTHFPSLHNGSSVSVANNVLSGFQLEPSSAASNSLMGLVPPSPDLCRSGRARSSAITDPLTNAMQSMQPMINVNTTLASSIESLSNINLDLHLKLQQQRLAMMYGGGDQKRDDDSVNVLQQPVNLFQNLEISKTQNLPAGSSVNQAPSGATTVTGTVPTEWFFGNSFPSVTHSAATSNVTGNGNGINDANNNWVGALSWGDFQHQQYSALP